MASSPAADEVLATFQALWADLQNVCLLAAEETARLRQVCHDCSRLLRPWPRRNGQDQAGDVDDVARGSLCVASAGAPDGTVAASASVSPTLDSTKSGATKLAERMDQVLAAALKAREPKKAAEHKSRQARKTAAGASALKRAAFSHGQPVRGTKSVTAATLAAPGATSGGSVVKKRPPAKTYVPVRGSENPAGAEPRSVASATMPKEEAPAPFLLKNQGWLAGCCLVCGGWLLC